MNPPLPMDGVLPPDLQGTLVRIGPGSEAAGALHAIELRDGAAVSYATGPSEADANVFWHAGSLLALAETGLPQRFSRALEPEEFDGGLSQPIASHVHRDSVTGGRVLFGVEPGTETSSPVLRIGEWDATGALAHYQGVALERATWQHDIGVTHGHVVFMESPTAYGEDLADDGVAVPFRWTPGAEGWIGVVDRTGDGTDVRWIRQDPCLVTHVLGAYDEGGGGRRGGAGGSWWECWDWRECWDRWGHCDARGSLSGARIGPALRPCVLGGRAGRDRRKPDRRRARRARTLAHRRHDV